MGETQRQERGQSDPLPSTIFLTESRPRWETDEAVPLISASSNEAATILAARAGGRGVGGAAAGGSDASGSGVAASSGRLRRLRRKHTALGLHRRARAPSSAVAARAPSSPTRTSLCVCARA